MDIGNLEVVLLKSNHQSRDYKPKRGTRAPSVCSLNDKHTTIKLSQLHRQLSLCGLWVQTGFDWHAQHGRSALLPNTTKFANKLLKTSLIDINESVGDKTLTCWRVQGGKAVVGNGWDVYWLESRKKRSNKNHASYMVNFLQQQESLIFWVILSCMENLTGYQLFMAALPLASRTLEKWFVRALKTPHDL